ncbi:hypothetical protein DTL42_00485 [Bremerella cremea]|uniref:Uncharacterized protein n=1 Tax=Bremerella cremea TaxID=1031537 RepID=A0A368KXS6_9BACT|nr:hypothetical protein [Bremerella cremea]RCS56094.1 hypothetical protein DTL42_00485 [Bremerella cremea]
MDIILICRTHKTIVSLGSVLGDGQETAVRGLIDSDIMSAAIMRFMFTHIDCDAGWVSDSDFYDMPLKGYVRAEFDLGLPFKGTRCIDADEAMEEIHKREELRRGK